MVTTCFTCNREDALPGTRFCSPTCERVNAMGTRSCRRCESEYPELARDDTSPYCSDECEEADRYDQLEPVEKKRIEFIRMITIMNNLSEMPASTYEKAVAFAKSADSAALNATFDRVMKAMHLE